MLSVELWLTFVGTAIGVVVIPGPGVLLTMAHSLEYGARRTLGTIGGCLTANLFHQMLVGAGVGGLVAQYPGVLETLKYFGALSPARERSTCHATSRATQQRPSSSCRASR